MKTRLLLFPDETVTKRVKDFREKYPNWTILPEIIEIAPDWIVVKAVIADCC